MPCWCVCVGPCPAYLVSAVLRGGKAQKNGKTAYCGSIRHSHASLCPHGSLGRYLVDRFTIEQEQFPSPCNNTQWQECALFRGTAASKSMSYSQQRDTVVKWFKQAYIISSKKTHSFRVAGSRLMDDSGVSEDVRHVTRTPCVHGPFHA